MIVMGLSGLQLPVSSRSWEGLSGLQETPLCRGPRACVLHSLDYNHPFMLLGRVGTESLLQACVTCGLVPAHSLGVRCGSPQRWLAGKTQSRCLPGSS